MSNRKENQDFRYYVYIANFVKHYTKREDILFKNITVWKVKTKD